MRHLRFCLVILSLLTTPAIAANYFTGAERDAALAAVELLKPIQARSQAKILSVPGVFGLGIGLDRTTGRFVFQAFVDKSKPLPTLPPALEGVPLRVVRDTPPVAVDGGSACMPCHANQLVLPVEMGNSGRPVAAGSSCGSCTMGFKACEPQTGNTVWVTAAHCATDATLCPGTAPVGTASYHSSPGDAFFQCNLTTNVGSVSLQAPPVPNGTVDAVSVVSDVSLTFPSVRDIGGLAVTTGTPLLGDDVQKSGRTTGKTTGSVDATNTAVMISYNCGAITLNQQVRIVDTTGDIFCTGGDSGSGVFDMGSPAQVVGLLVARNAAGTTCWANTASNVLSALGLSMNHAACVENACPAIDLAGATSAPVRVTRLLYLFRDDVLAESEAGRARIRTFYSVAAEWVALYAQRPGLFQATRNSLEQNLPVLDALAHRRPVTVSRAALDSVRQLLDRHIAAAQSESLRAAFQTWRKELDNPAVWSEFNVTVR